jgi:hypothetical protein
VLLSLRRNLLIVHGLFIASKLCAFLKTPWIAVTFCSVALFGQAVLPPVHIWLEVREFEEAVHTESLAAFAPAQSGHFVLHGQQAEGHDESTCPVCNAVKFGSLVSLLAVAVITLVMFRLLASIPRLHAGVGSLEDWKILPGRSPPFLA